MPTVIMRPNQDLALLDWSPTPAGTHFSAIDGSPDVPDLTDHISTADPSKVDEEGLTDAPEDYVSSNTVNLRVHGESPPPLGAGRAFFVELRKADETFLASVTLGLGVGRLTVESTPQSVDLTLEELNGLKIRHETDFALGDPVFVYETEVILDYDKPPDVTGGRLLPLVPIVNYIVAAWAFVVAVVTKSGKETGVAHDTVTTISFTTAFATTPNVVVTIDRTAVTDIKFLQVTNVLTTGFDVRFKFKTAATTDIQWIATDAGDP